MARIITATAIVLFVGVAGVVSYRLAQQRVTNDIYRQRLERIAGEYEQLRGLYNEAVRKTAVTELIVAEGQLSVEICTADGRRQSIATPFDPNDEIYCDYIVANGRLWVRRLYDQHTPPREGLLIDSALADVDWTDPAYKYGNAVYRSLSEGRWVVTVTGDGSLGLAKREDDAPTPLEPAPPVGDYAQIEAQIASELEQIRMTEVIRHLW